MKSIYLSMALGLTLALLSACTEKQDHYPHFAETDLTIIEARTADMIIVEKSDGSVDTLSLYPEFNFEYLLEDLEIEKSLGANTYTPENGPDSAKVFVGTWNDVNGDDLY